MCDRPILYLKAGSIPSDWRSCRVLYANGREVRDVLEANAHEGWFVQAVRAKGVIQRRRDGSPVTRKVWSKIRIERVQ